MGRVQLTSGILSGTGMVQENRDAIRVNIEVLLLARLAANSGICFRAGPGISLVFFSCRVMSEPQRAADFPENCRI